MHIFANPNGGPERLSHIDHLVAKYTKDESIWFVDSARAYLASCMDNPDRNNKLFRINHNDKEHGFVWHFFVDFEEQV